MSSSEDKSAASSVMRAAFLTQEGERYALALMENEKPVSTLVINAKEQSIHEDLEWQNRMGVGFSDAKYAMVTKGSSFIFKGNQYPVDHPTPFEPQQELEAEKENKKTRERAEVDGLKKQLDRIIKLNEGHRRQSLEKEKDRPIPEVHEKKRRTLGEYLKFVNREDSINILLKLFIKEREE